MHVNPEEYLNQPIFQILFHQNTQAMWIVDDETLSFLEVNDSAVRMYGYSREEFLTMTLLDLNVGVPLECKSSGNETFILETSHFNKSKQVVEVEETLYPFVFNQKESRLSSVRDITAKKKRAVLAEYLMLATEVVGIAVNTSTALEQISDLIVPKFADWFTINVVNGEDIDLLVVKNDSQEYMDWSLDHRRRNPLTIHGQGATQHALRTGESFLVPVVTPEMLEQAIQDKEQLEMIKKLNLRSSIIVPMKVQNRTTGTINFISTVDGKQYDEIDLQFATDFALRIGLSLENARLNELALQEKRQVELSQQNLNRMIMQAPVAMCILSGQEYVIDVANETMFKLWGLGTEFSKRPIFEGLPHLKKAFKPLLDEVYYDDKALNFDEAPVELIREEALETRFLNFTYRPVKEADGSTSGVLAVAIDVTSQVVSRRKIEEAEEEAQAMNEELTSMNEELSSANEEQAAINEELLAARMESEIERERLKSFIMLAPAGICVLGGSDLVFELVNPAYQELLPGRNLEGRAILEALPELTGTPVEDILKNVYKTGERFTVNELLIPVAEHEGGKTRDRFFTFNYLARKNNQGTIDGILAFVYEVTENVNSRREVERAEESLRMAAESAELGIWQLQQSSQKLTVSPRFYQLFGLQESDGISFDKVMALVQDEYKESVAQAIDQSLNNGSNFRVEYPMIRADNAEVRWIRSIGKMIRNEQDGDYMTGVLVDITAQKQEEERKNDFIGMVSHELKTPLTSLTAYLQMLQNKATKGEDTFTLGALDQSVKQVRKMSVMINGFLNVTRLESGQIHLENQRANLADILKEIEEETVSLNSSHDIIFHPVEETIVFGDRNKIGQVISNLISNAIKYSSTGTLVQVACVLLNGNAVISVKDEGMGISAADMPFIFERYYRVENNNRVSGFGIGLYLSSEIVKRHNGRIWAESATGKGSSFYFSLPVIL